jgi:hypothetical protein
VIRPDGNRKLRNRPWCVSTVHYNDKACCKRKFQLSVLPALKPIEVSKWFLVILVLQPSPDQTFSSRYKMVTAKPTTVISGADLAIATNVGGITMKGQDKLPHLPIPPLEDTMKRYVRALEGLQVRCTTCSPKLSYRSCCFRLISRGSSERELDSRLILTLPMFYCRLPLNILLRRKR